MLQTKIQNKSLHCLIGPKYGLLHNQYNVYLTKILPIWWCIGKIIK